MFEDSRFAGIPPTKICMNCHSEIFATSPFLAPIRESFESGRPVSWARVHDLPDFVYFDHSVHVARGFDCAICHGDVGSMARVMQIQPLTMGWCLDCHRDAWLANVTREVPANAWEATAQMITDLPSRHREITSLVTCTACHR